MNSLSPALFALQDAHWFPEQASTMAGQVDYIYLARILVATFFSVGIFLALIVLGVRYRRSRSQDPTQIEGSVPLEILWSAVPLLICLGFFGWGTKLFIDLKTIPQDGLEITVTGKQWMWKIQHPTGQREINTLHVPLGKKVILTMTSEDVIHSFFVPAFRTKQDVVPGMYTQTWFEATKEGSFHLFCSEYCGADHARMIGRVIVMAPEEYEQWLSGQPETASPAEAGAALFTKLNCNTCHAAGSGQRGPNLAGRFGGVAVLQGGGSVPFDASYVRESILNPKKRLSAGYEAIMPTYKGQVTEEEIFQLVAFIRSIGSGEDSATAETPGEQPQSQPGENETGNNESGNSEPSDSESEDSEPGDQSQDEDQR